MDLTMKCFNRCTSTGVFIGLVVAGPLGVPMALAGDGKVFASQFCVPVDDDERTDTANIDVHERALENRDDEPRDFVCPLMRDTLKEDIDQVWVRVGNNPDNPDEQTQCCLYSFDPFGQNSDFKCEPADSDEGNQSIEIQGVQAWDNGYYVLRCTLEFGEELFSYRSEEP